MEMIQSTLTLFLQLTAILVLLFTWLPLRKTQIRLASPVIALNLDLALRKKTYGGSQCLASLVDKFFGNATDGEERIVYGFRPPFRDPDVIKDLAEWQSPEYLGPPHSGGTGDNDQRWESELKGLKWRYGFEGMSSDEDRYDKWGIFKMGPLARLHEVLRRKYAYDLGNFDWDEQPSRLSYKYFEDESDLFVHILEQIERVCPDNKERVSAFHDLGRAAKVINIIQLKNPYHESLHNIHLRISYANRGILKLISTFAEKEGFSITNSGIQDAHLTLGELPANSARYCIVETGVRPLSENDIELQSDLLYRLNPTIMKTIFITSALASLGLSLLMHFFI